ncbi:hypothetical protein Tco_1190534 [Tanacetum coccineum]
MFGNNELEAGDQVSVTNRENHRGAMVTECGISPVYSDRDKESVDPLSFYKSWKHIIGGDLSAFEWASGNYDLTNFKVCPSADDFKRLFFSETRFKMSLNNMGRVQTKPLNKEKVGQLYDQWMHETNQIYGAEFNLEHLNLFLSFISQNT